MVWVLRNKNLRTSSGPEGSSDKWNLLCAADQPSPSSCGATKGHFSFILFSQEIKMYTALYRSFRPETFDSVLGQEHIVKILKNQINTGTTSHAYLFCGTRGTGKTSTARILAKGVNCLNEDRERPCGVCSNCISIKGGTFIDVIEIDAASNNGVENIRELRESVKYPPAIGKCKVYIIDEVHMLSTGAFNALLKTLEEPPQNVMFILATTEVQKLPATILSRCLRLDFKRVSEHILRFGLREICGQLGIKISEAALGLIAANADGSVRDGLSLLDQCISAGDKSVTREVVLELLGTAGEETFIEMTDLLKNRNVAEALLLLDRVIADGKDVRQFMKDWVSHFRGLLITKFIKNPEDVLNLSWENIERIKEQSQKLDLYFINECILEISKTITDAKWSTQPRILLELCIIRLSSLTGELKPEVKLDLKSDVKPDAKSENKPKIISVISETEESKSIDSESKSKPIESKQLDISSLWHKVFEDGETLKGSFNFIRLGTTLKEIGDTTFTVEVTNENILQYTKENSAELESLMEKHTGKKLRMECILSNQCEDEKNTVEDLVSKIENKFGINIEIQ